MDSHTYTDSSIGGILNETFVKLFQEDSIRGRYDHDLVIIDGVWDRLYRRFMRRLLPVMFPLSKTSLRINTAAAKYAANMINSSPSASMINSPKASTSPSSTRKLSSGGFLLTSFNLSASMGISSSSRDRDRASSSASSNSSTADDDDVSESELQFLNAFGK